MENSKLKYIYRICDKNPNTHYKDVSKFECLKNFRDFAGTENVKIIADNCSMTILAHIKTMGFTNIDKTSLGNSKSFEYAVDKGIELDNNDIVYLVEDDYLHKKESPFIIREGLDIADFVSLYDHPDKYGSNTPNPLVQHGGELTRVLLTKSTHWKATNSTTMTFACKVSTLKKYAPVMKHYLDVEIPRDYLMWRDILHDSMLITPMPGYSTHCHEPWISPLWKEADYV